jgi:D-3-phosphoglycerate dehydrogenase / 2-oxoglutarate reductase
VIIFSTHPLHPDPTAELQSMGEYRIASAPTADVIAEECRGAGLIVVRAPIPDGVALREQGLRAFIRHGAGVDMINIPESTSAGVLVCNVPGANAQTVAEHAIWTAMALLRRYPIVAHEMTGGGWASARSNADHGRDLSGLTLGLLGLGNVGKAVARIAHHGFGMTVVAHTRSRKGSAEVEALGFYDLLQRCDILVLCAPLTDETQGLMDARALASMKQGAILINVARGPLVVEKALVEALSSGHLGGAALDVFDTQPLQADHPFRSLPNMILTPHMAGITADSMLRMGQGVVREAQRILAGHLPTNLVNADAVQHYRNRFPG